MKVPDLSSIFELEDDIRRTENQLKVQRWAHGLLLKQVQRDPVVPEYKLVLARLSYRLKLFLHHVSTQLINW